jgi:hypothetical protein
MRVGQDGSNSSLLSLNWGPHSDGRDEVDAGAARYGGLCRCEQCHQNLRPNATMMLVEVVPATPKTSVVPSAADATTSPSMIAEPASTCHVSPANFRKRKIQSFAAPE